jgi:glycosyltransferase involved in cell wall biosynthesis
MKDHASFLAAMRALPNHNALLVGSGTETLPLPPNVRALGPRADPERLYPAADIVVSSSAFGEGFSNTIAEGMSSGLVPVATDVGDTSLIVGTTGKIVPPRDPVALAEGLAEMASLAPHDRQKRGQAAREHILRSFGLSKAVETFERAYLCKLQCRRPF